MLCFFQGYILDNSPCIPIWETKEIIIKERCQTKEDYEEYVAFMSKVIHPTDLETVEQYIEQIDGYVYI
jgi:hypothetical protein